MPTHRRQSLRSYLRSPRSRRAPVTRPVAVRLRRLLDGELVAAAYDRTAPGRMPIEIVDLADGTRLCEWSTEVEHRAAFTWETPAERTERLLAHVVDGAPLLCADVRECSWHVPTVVRYASEADMWRALHAMARVGGGRPLCALSEPAIRGWSESRRHFGDQVWRSYDDEDAPRSRDDQERLAVDDARRAAASIEARAADLVAEKHSGMSARSAWIDRPAHLAVVVAGCVPRAQRVQVPGEADDRRLDSLGRRNAGAAHRMAARAGTLRP